MFAAVGTAVFGDSGIGAAFIALLIITVLTSAAASTQTTILPTARATLSMGAYRALPERFARVHLRFLTPTWSTWAWASRRSSFYYGLTGFACAWFHWRTLRGRALWTRGVLPLTGGILLLTAFVLSCIDDADPQPARPPFSGSAA